MSEMRYAILDEDHNVVPLDIDNREEAMRRWGRFFEDTDNRRVGAEEVGDVRVSTVFLGLNHQYFDGEEPLWFETMVFGGEHDQDMDRYTTWEQAEAGHKEVVRRLKEGLAPWPEEKE